jgi:Flp pilus assembly protein TadD
VALAVALHQRNGVWRTGETLWRDSAEKAPRKARAHLSLGFAYRERGRYAEAIATYQRGLEVVGNDQSMELQLLRNLSAALLWAGRPDEAVVALERARRIGPNDTDILTNLAVASLAKGDLAGAERWARQAVTLNPGQGDAWNALGAVLIDKPDLPAAEEALRRAMALDPDIGVRPYNLGRALAKRGDRAGACAEWGRALRGRVDPALRAEIRRLRAQGACPP